MEYYILNCAVDTKETGRAFPQVEFKNPKKLEPNPCLVANKTNKGEYLPENIPPFDYMELARGAKLTDLMTSPLRVNGFLVSKKLKELFEKEGVKHCRYYPVTIFNKNIEVKDYFYFHTTSCLRDYVDYSKSTFCVTSAGVFEYDIPKQDSYSSLKEYQEKNLEGIKVVTPKQLYLKANFPFSHPLFRILIFDLNFFITRKLKEAMEASKITGLQVVDAKDLIKTDNLS